MFSTVTPARPAALRIGAVRPLAATVAVLALAAGGTAAGLADDATVAPPEPRAAPQASAVFGDAAVLKGARADNPAAVLPPLFGDPAVRKGARGR